MSKNELEQEFRLAEGRLAWVEWPDEPGDDEKFECTVLIPKDGNEDFEEDFEDFLVAHSEDKLGSDSSKYWGSCFKDGDEVNEDLEADGKELREEYEGCWLVTCKTKFQPPLMNPDKQLMKDPVYGRGAASKNADVYSGCWAFVTVSPYQWKYKKKEGIGLNWCSAWITDDTSKPFSGGGHNPESAYEDAKTSRKPKRRRGVDEDEDSPRNKRKSRRGGREEDDRQPKRRGRSRDEEEDEDEDEDDEDDEDGDRPRGRSSRKRPSSRKRERYEEEDDEDEEEDDEDETPRQKSSRRRSNAKKRSSRRR